MDFDEIQTVIVNAHLTERLSNENNSYRWKLKTFGEPALHEIAQQYLMASSPADRARTLHLFVREPIGRFCFETFIGSSVVPTFDFYVALRNVLSGGSRVEKARAAQRLKDRLYFEVKAIDPAAAADFASTTAAPISSLSAFGAIGMSSDSPGTLSAPSPDGAGTMSPSPGGGGSVSVADVASKSIGASVSMSALGPATAPAPMTSRFEYKPCMAFTVEELKTLSDACQALVADANRENAYLLGKPTSSSAAAADADDGEEKVDPEECLYPIRASAEKLEEKHLLEKWKGFVSDEQIWFRRFVQLKEYSSRKVSVKDFQKIRIVGKGAFGAVYAVEKLDTHKIYAWKQMDKRKLKHDKSFDVALNELRRLIDLQDCPFVTGLQYSMQTDNAVVLAMDFYSGGDLKYHMKYSSPDRRKKPFAPEVARFYAAEILLGLEEMHRNGIIYRDLKPANVLLDDSGHVHISDLGLAKKLTKDRPYSTGLSGTPGYWSPEVLCRTPYSLWADWWSFGIVLYELLCGKRPPCVCKKGTKQWCTFSDRKESEENALSEDGVYMQELYFPVKYFSPEAEDLIRKLLQHKPANRLGYAGGADEIKKHPFFEGVDFEALRAGRVEPPFVPRKRGVNAKSIAEVGEFDSRDYRKLRLTADDEKVLAQFDWQDDRIVQNELVEVLKQELPKGGKFTDSEFISGQPEEEKYYVVNCCKLS